jgi:hypothetical protein
MAPRRVARRVPLLVFFQSLQCFRRDEKFVSCIKKSERRTPTVVNLNNEEELIRGRKEKRRQNKNRKTTSPISNDDFNSV